ncbi:MAG: L-ribulose-5-phosphate 3-epimerase [Oscillospiraceae bacterium]
MLGNHLLGIYEKAFDRDMTMPKRAIAARKMGFEFIELSIDESDERLERLYWSSEKQIEFARQMRDEGMPLRTICFSGHRRFPFGSSEPSTAEKARELMRRCIDFAGNTGARVIQLAGYDVYYEKSTDETKAAFLDGLKYACRLAEKYQIMLSMEIMDTEFINSISKNKVYSDILKSPWYSVYPDLGNLSAWGNNVENELAIGIDEIAAVHIKDTLAVTDSFGGKFKEVPFGTGCVDFRKCFEKLEELGYCGPYMIEMWADSKTSCIEEIASAKRFVEMQFGKCADL